MGYLDDLGPALTNKQMQPHQSRFKKIIAAQFINLLKTYERWEKADSELLIWGDQIQAHMIKLDPPRLYTPDQLPQCKIKLMPQYGRWMIQTIPQYPYLSADIICDVIKSMQQRYQEFRKLPCSVISIPSIPFLGVNPDPKRPTEVAKSNFIDDRIISRHQRFPTLTKNIRERREEKVCILAPIFVDKRTILDASQQQPYPGYVYMDAMAFGMGMCCLQTTYLTKNICHARYLYDQLSILSPFFMAISAGTPFAKGKLLNTDTRWDMISDSVDDRNSAQRDKKSSLYIPKSRYSSISQYLSNVEWNLPQYEDIYFPLNQQAMDYAKQLAKQKQIDIDQRLIKHIGFLTKRDLNIAYQNIIQQSQKENLLFQHLNSTNWNNVRFKPPPRPDSQIGWRVQFRTVEIQATAHQNAALVIFLTYFIKVIQENAEPILNFYLPISYVDKNFERAKKIDAVINQKFYFRINVQDKDKPLIKQLKLIQIMFGCSCFDGLIPIIQRINSKKKDRHLQDNRLFEFLPKIKQYIKAKLNGERLTLAKWMRKFILQHKDYKHDSIIPLTTCNDLLKKIVNIQKGEQHDQNFFKFTCSKSS